MLVCNLCALAWLFPNVCTLTVFLTLQTLLTQDNALSWQLWNPSPAVPIACTACNRYWKTKRPHSKVEEREPAVSTLSLVLKHPEAARWLLCRSVTFPSAQLGWLARPSLELMSQTLSNKNENVSTIICTVAEDRSAHWKRLSSLRSVFCNFRLASTHFAASVGSPSVHNGNVKIISKSLWDHTHLHTPIPSQIQWPGGEFCTAV